MLAVLVIAISAFVAPQTPPKIDRVALVKRHNVLNTSFDSLSSLSVGNGEFAFTVDPTGLQTFPEFYHHGVPLGTQTQWGWHSLPNDQNFKLEEVSKDYESHGRKVPYTYNFSGNDRKGQATKWLRENPHRLHLGMIGFQIKKADGSLAKQTDIKNIRQELNLWTGEIKSHFEVDKVPVDVVTLAHQQQDALAVQVKSPLLDQGRLQVRFRFPNGSTDWEATYDWTHPEKHTTKLEQRGKNEAVFKRQLDTTRYVAALRWNGTATVQEKEAHTFDLTPTGKNASLSFTCRFTNGPKADYAVLTFDEAQKTNQTAWNTFWTTGGAVDLSGSTDPRAKELERRIVLSQYLTKIQCSGSAPPQETGLTYNSWYGKPHLEMHWWHAAHFALWNRTPLMERSLGWYEKIRPVAEDLAKRQGFEGVRWPKMVDQAGNDSPSPIASFLIWQQPHFIYMAELAYRDNQSKAVLDKYKNLVEETAKFMASYAYFDKEKGKYILGKGLIPAQERFKPELTFNPPFELAYWHWGLSVAQKWRERTGQARNPEWDKVIKELSPLAVKDGLYLAAESFPDSYTNPAYMTDHPVVLGAYGYLPGDGQVDVATMNRTFDHVMKVWSWEQTWGWDYPMVAMSAARLGKPDKAVDALMMKVTKNTYLPNGHNYQRDNLRIYLPGNGGLLMAVAMMCAGWDGYQGAPTPGFPKDGTWTVRWENLDKMP